MDSSTEEIYFQKLQELVEDEDKIVTISCLANILSISVQDSVRILTKYFEDNEKLKPDKLAATYILTGILKNDRGTVVRLVKDCDIKSKTEEFKEVLNKCLYSIQKSKAIDFNVLALVDWPNLTSSVEKLKPLSGTVRSKNCTKRILKFKILPPPPAPAIKGKSSFFAPKTDTKTNGSLTEPNNTNAASKAITTSKSGTISNLFNKAADNKKEFEKKDQDKKHIPKEKTVKSSFSSFFSKSSSNLSSNGSIKSEELEVKQTDNKNDTKKSEKKQIINSNGSEDSSNTPMEQMDLGSDIEIEDGEKSPVEKVKKPAKSSNKKKETNKSTKRLRDKSDEKSNKKRRRIIESNDSDSDDIFGNDENEADIIEKSDEEQRNLSPVPIKPLAAKNRKRVAVDRSYIDEEGFMVTKKEYVYESPSDDEADKAPPEQEKKEEKTVQKPIEKKNSASSDTNTSPQKGGKGKKAKKNVPQNQPTLMNFFKKK